MKHQGKIRSEINLSQFRLDTHSLKLPQPCKREIVRAWQAAMVVKFYKPCNFINRTAIIAQCFNDIPFQITITLNFWLMRRVSIFVVVLWILLTTDEFILKRWWNAQKHAKIYQKVYPTIGTVSSRTSLLLSQCEDYFWQEILQGNSQEPLFIVAIKNRGPLGKLTGKVP